MTNKETIAIRCAEYGRYDMAAQLYAMRINGVDASDRRDLGVKVHAEIVALNPAIEVVFAKDVTLDFIGQTLNLASFDMDHAGKLAFIDPPLQPITQAYLRLRDP
jgi:hypothetical protein